MQVTYLDKLGDDLTVVNAARVSFAKLSTGLTMGDAKLIRYLAKHNHWTPFGHPQISMRFKAPIFVARQLAKHQTGLVWNEVSRRYVDDPPEFYYPEDGWRKRADNVKQGSSEDDVIPSDDPEIYIGPPNSWNDHEMVGYSEVVELCEEFYDKLLNMGVCPEQARMILPQSMMTEWVWTGSLAAWARTYKLRIDAHTQKETRYFAEEIDKVVQPLFPVSWSALVKGE